MNTTTAGRVDYRRPGRPTSAHTIKVSGVMGEPQFSICDVTKSSSRELNPPPTKEQVGGGGGLIRSFRDESQPPLPLRSRGSHPERANNSARIGE